MSSDAECWEGYLDAASAGLQQLLVTARGGERLTVSDGFTRWLAMTLESRSQARYIYFIGNGASAMMASHFAADACKNAGLRALALNDAALLTATANDLAFEDIFSLPLSRLARPGDLLIAISSSGNSPNILRAVEMGRSIPTQIVTLTGMTSDNRARACGDVNFYVPSRRYGWVECAHQLVLHYWLDQFLNLYVDGAL